MYKKPQAQKKGQKMNIEYKCCFCRKSYDWYSGLYENPKYNIYDELKARRRGEEYNEEKGVYIPANGFTLCKINPIDDRIDAKEAIEIDRVGGNLDLYINICPDCMRKLLDNLYANDSNINAWGTI